MRPRLKDARGLRKRRQLRLQVPFCTAGAVPQAYAWHAAPTARWPLGTENEPGRKVQQRAQRGKRMRWGALMVPPWWCGKMYRVSAKLRPVQR